MAKLAIKKASTDVTTYVFIQDSSKTTGEGLTGLAYNTGSLVGYYVRPKGSATAITLATQTVTGDHSDGGFVEIDATNMPGVYRLDLPDAVCATGVPSVVVMLKGATNMSPVVLEIQLTDFDLNAAGVTLATSQPAITWGQQKIIADVEREGALDIRNTNEDGVGLFNSGNIAQYNEGGAVGVVNNGPSADVMGFDPDIKSGLALEATLTAIKGAGWANETLVKIVTDIAAISAGSGATAQEVWEYATRVLTAGTNIDLSALATAADLATVDTVVDAIKAKTDNLPADPAAVGSAMTLTAAYDKAKDDVLTPLAVVDGIVDAIKAQTDKIPSSPASAGEYTANIGAIKAKTDNLPLSPASSGEYTSALTAIQNDLDNPNQYKADVSNLALQATSLAIKGQTDKIPAAPAQTGEYNAALAAIQSDLDNPNQYKADVSGLATQASVNAIPTTPLLAANYVAPDNAGIAAIKAKTDSLTFTTPNKVDASATVDPTGIATSAELEIVGGKVDGVLNKLNVSSVEFVTAVVGSTITILRGDTLTASLLNLGSMESYVSIDFTVKRNTSNTDDEAVIRIRKNASGTGDGLLRLNRAAPTTETGEIVIDDEATGDITITLDETATDGLEVGAYLYDVQLITATAVKTLTSGRLNVTSDVTRAIA